MNITQDEAAHSNAAVRAVLGPYSPWATRYTRATLTPPNTGVTRHSARNTMPRASMSGCAGGYSEAHPAFVIQVCAIRKAAAGSGAGAAKRPEANTRAWNSCAISSIRTGFAANTDR